MKKLIWIVLFLTTSSLANAQSTGTGTAWVASANPTGLDLPIEEPVFGNPNQKVPPIHEDINIVDPRDEPPPILYGEEIDSESDTIFYVIDVSGSMDWDTQDYTDPDGHVKSGNRMERAKNELIKSISGLSKNFKFDILAFDCGTYLWQNQMQQANPANKASALGWVSELHPLDSTGTGPATSLALMLDRRNMSVVLLTDGAPNCGATDHRMMIRMSNAQCATINVFGIAASGSYRNFCQDVAADSGGSYFDIP